MLFHDIETPRLLLTGIAPEDRDFIFRQFSDPDVTAYLFDEEPYTDPREADGLIEFYREPEPRGQHRWILRLKDNGKAVGTCGFHCWDRENASAQIGYDLLKEYRGQGLMSEAVDAILAFARMEMGLRRVDAHISKDNGDSLRFAARLGFQDSGEDFMLNFRGEDHPHAVYSLDLGGK